ncbi:unnamed protein product [Pipistrellus nathusii]|uniref:Uncharacterized protein n=1 Tax=Pipistrellus nathusii TaxID=59473 RepID=A0ABN9ZCB7_PIPNA
MYITYNNSTIATVQQITMHKAVLKTFIKPGVRRSLNQRTKPTMSTQTERQGSMTGMGDCRTLTRRNRDRTMPALKSSGAPKHFCVSATTDSRLLFLSSLMMPISG